MTMTTSPAMKTCVSGRAVAGFVAAALALTSLTARAADVPFGHGNWKPSPTDPVGFAGRGGNWYPGASPPTEWSEGTPAVVKGRIGNPKHTFKYGEYPREADLYAYADNTAKNILWKVPVPGWSDSLPVVVGKRVISLTSPHHVTCYDADTGEVLWQDELKLMTLPVLGPDRRSAGPAPDPATAAARQDLFERTLAWVRVRIGATAIHRDRKDVGPADRAPRAPLIEHAIAVLERWKEELKAHYPDIGPSLDVEIAVLKDCLAGKPEAERKVSGARVQKIGRYAGTAPRIYSPTPDLITYAAAKLGLLPEHFCNCWQGVLSDTVATPVSDGEVVCVTFGSGQVGAYDLATGRRLWAWRDPAMNAASASHCPSPLLWKDLMIFMAGGKDEQARARGRKRRDYSTTTMAVDKRTGAVRWEVPGGPGGSWWGESHGDHMSPCLVRLPDGRGSVRGAVVTNKGAILDAETGATLAQLPEAAGEGNSGIWQAGYVCYAGGRIARGSAGDNYSPPVSVWPVGLAGEMLRVETGFVADAKAGQSPFVYSDRFGVCGGSVLFDAATGARTAELPRPPGRAGRPGGTATLAGDLLIIAHEDVEADNMRIREDRMALLSFSVFDVSDPGKPRLVSSGNLLGSTDCPADIADRYFPEFAKPQWKIFALGCYRGLASHFGVRTGGVTAHGSRLYVKSQTHLYCIGAK